MIYGPTGPYSHLLCFHIESNVNKNNKITLFILAAIATSLGITDYLTYYYPVAGNVVTTILLMLALALIFYWYWLDSHHYKYKRTIFLNISVIVVFWLAIPYYLYSSRTETKRFIAISGFLATFLIWYAFHYAGFYILWAIERI